MTSASLQVAAGSPLTITTVTDPSGQFATVTVTGNTPPAPVTIGVNDTLHFPGRPNLASSLSIQSALKANGGAKTVRTWLCDEDWDTGTFAAVTQTEVNARLNAVTAAGCQPYIQLAPLQNMTYAEQLVTWVAAWAASTGNTVPWFEIGNEFNWNGTVFTAGDYGSTTNYTGLWNTIVPYIKTKLPAAKFAAFATPGGFSDGGYLAYLADMNTHGAVMPDAVSLHKYWNPGSAAALTAANVAANYGAGQYGTAKVRADIDGYPNLKGLPLHLTEWGFNTYGLTALPAWAQTASFQTSYVQQVLAWLNTAPNGLTQAFYFTCANEQANPWIDLFNTTGTATSWLAGL